MASSPRRREGSFYAMIVVGAIVLIGLIAGLQVQMDQQMARVRRMKGSAQAALIAREAVDAAGRKLAATGSLPQRTSESLEGGEVVIAVEGPRPAGSRKYIVFARARFAAAAVTAVADVRFASPSAQVCNVDMLYQDVDVDSAAARAKVVDQRREARRALKDTLQSYRGEGGGLSPRLAAFLSTAAGGSIPRADQARVVSALPSPLTTEVP
jgi:hypothetical protein